MGMVVLESGWDTVILGWMPAGLMAAVAVSVTAAVGVGRAIGRPVRAPDTPADRLAWRALMASSWLALMLALVSAIAAVGGMASSDHTVLPAWMAVVVQCLGTVVAGFSGRYLQGEQGQMRYVAALAGVLASVHLLLRADHWWVLIGAWALVGWTLHPLLCFYRDRPFAVLAAHKKWVADRVADVLLLAAAGLAWRVVGSGGLGDLDTYLAQHQGATLPWALQASAVCLVLAAILRTALLPVHGWLTQVMEAPTPVSALLHAGVVNLSGVVLIRLAPLLEAAPVARGLLVAFGLATACLAGLVMLTRISIKVRLAWSTVAQMGFLMLECGLGLYTLAALHLMGHSLYKAHAFLSASGVVRVTRLQRQQGTVPAAAFSLWLAPALALAVLIGVQTLTHTVTAGWLPHSGWPWWWLGVLALVWAPLLWWPQGAAATLGAWQVASGAALVCALAVASALAHALPLGVHDRPVAYLGVVACVGMAVLYGAQAAIQRGAAGMAPWRRWSYAGFYVDEVYTRVALRLWPVRWGQPAGGQA